MYHSNVMDANNEFVDPTYERGGTSTRLVRGVMPPSECIPTWEADVDSFMRHKLPWILMVGVPGVGKSVKMRSVLRHFEQQNYKVCLLT